MPDRSRMLAPIETVRLHLKAALRAAEDGELSLVAALIAEAQDALPETDAIDND